MSSGRILLSLFCEQLSAHPAPSGASLLGYWLCVAVFSARKLEGTLQRCLLLLICLARRFYRVLGLRLFHAPVIQAFS